MHRSHFRWLLPLCLLAVTFPLSGCLFRTRIIERQLSNAPLKTATQEQLIDYVDTQAGKIQSMQATVDIDSSAGNPATGRVTDYKEIRGYILARKPDMLRMKGLMPVVRNTAFDMVSDGKEFKLWIPPRNKFVIGEDNDTNYQPDKRIENLRPQYFYNALLLPAIGPDEIAVLENGYETVLDSKKHRVDQPDYELAVIRKGPQGWYLVTARPVQPHRPAAPPSANLRPAGKCCHRRPLPELQGLQRNFISDEHRNRAATRELRHNAEHPQTGPEPASSPTISSIWSSRPGQKIVRLGAKPGAATQVLPIALPVPRTVAPTNAEKEDMMNRMIVGNLVHRPIRSLISIVAVALEVTMILLIVGLCLGMMQDSRARTAGIGADILVRPPGSSFIGAFSGAPMPVKVGGVLANLPHVKSVAPVITQVATSGSIEIIAGIDLPSYESMSPASTTLRGGRFRAPTTSWSTTFLPSRSMPKWATPSKFSTTSSAFVALSNAAREPASSFPSALYRI